MGNCLPENENGDKEAVADAAATEPPAGMLTALRRDRYFNVEGRAGRREFWLFILLLVCVAAGIANYMVFTGAVYFRDWNSLFSFEHDSTSLGLIIDSFPFWTAKILALLLFLGLVTPLVTVSVRRFRDAGFSPLWLIWTLLLPVMDVWRNLNDNGDFIHLAELAGILFTLWVLVRSSRNPQKYKRRGTA